MTEATYKFEYAIQRLREAINYSEQVRDYTQIRIWVNHVEAAYNADIKAEQELTASANEGAYLMYMYGQGGEAKLLQDLGMDEVVKTEREPYTDRTVTVPQKLRSYASYKNTGKGQPLLAEDVDGERLGE